MKADTYCKVCGGFVDKFGLGHQQDCELFMLERKVKELEGFKAEALEVAVKVDEYIEHFVWGGAKNERPLIFAQNMVYNLVKKGKISNEGVEPAND